MPVIKDGKLIEDTWVVLEDGEKAKENSLFTVERFLADFEADLLPESTYGLALDSDDEVTELENKLGQVEIITINFPSFADGRGFSQARLLRERLGYKGEIRAVGHIIRDQYVYLLRSGVNAISADRATEAEWNAAVAEFDTFYQPALTDEMPQALPASHLRHRYNTAAAAD